MPRQATYHIAPNFNITPETREIALGNIIASLQDPDRSLSRVDDAALSLRYPPVSTVRAGGRDLTSGKSRSISGELWSDFALSTVGGSIGGSLNTSLLDKFQVESFETSSFTSDPDFDELELRLKAPRVERIAKPNRLGRHRPVYMVSAVVVARGITVQMERRNEREGEVGANASVPTPAGDVGVGASLGGSSSRTRTDGWTVYGDRVIAYRLLEIKVTGLFGKEVETQTHRDGAEMFSQNAGGDDGDSDEDDDSWVKGKVEVGDVTATEIHQRSVQTEDGELVICRPTNTQVSGKEK